jgi:hypothetical protein
MKPRGLVLLPVMAAVLSTSAIVASAQSAARPRRVPFMTLKKFDVKFNKMINHAIRNKGSVDVSAEAQQLAKANDFVTLVATQCFTSFISVSAQATGLDADAKNLVKLTRAEKQELRNLVDRWLDDIYLGKPDEQLKALKRNPHGDFFSEKIYP